MIKKIAICDFQSHVKTELDLHPGVNVLLGKTDSGKSAVLRALRWLTDNVPSGDGFRPQRSSIGDSRVSIVLADGTVVTRVRGDDTNSYSVDGMELKAFGRNVPKEVSDVVNMQDINWQGQLDPPFLITESPASAARMLNKIADLDIIDRSLKKVNTKVSRISSEIKLREEDLEEAKSGLSSFKGLDEADGLLTSLEAKEQEANKLRRDIDGLKACLKDITEQRLCLESIPDPTEPKRMIASMLKKHREAEQYTADIEELMELVADIEFLEGKLGDLTDEYQSKKQEFDDLMPNQCPLCKSEIDR